MLSAVNSEALLPSLTQDEKEPTGEGTEGQSPEGQDGNVKQRHLRRADAFPLCLKSSLKQRAPTKSSENIIENIVWVLIRKVCL